MPIHIILPFNLIHVVILSILYSIFCIVKSNILKDKRSSLCQINNRYTIKLRNKYLEVLAFIAEIHTSIYLFFIFLALLTPYKKIATVLALMGFLTAIARSLYILKKIEKINKVILIYILFSSTLMIENGAYTISITGNLTHINPIIVLAILFGTATITDLLPYKGIIIKEIVSAYIVSIYYGNFLFILTSFIITKFILSFTNILTYLLFSKYFK